MLEEKHPIRQVLVPLSLSVIVLIRLNGKTVADPDLWGYMTFGRLFWDSKTFPYQDIFTYLPKYDRWIYHEWLTGVGLYPIYKFTGGFGLVFLRDLIALATLGFLYLAARIRKSSRASALFWLVLASGLLKVGYGTALRAQTFTYLFTAVTLYLLERSRQKGQWFLLLLFVPIQIVWCNLHGGFLAGLGIIAIYIVGEALSRRTWWPYLSVFLLAVLSTLINPYGVDYWTYLFHAVTLPRSEITEWASIFTAYARQSISFGEIFWYASIGILSLRILAWAHWREITSILLLSVTFLLGIQHVRHEVFFMMFVAVYLPEPSQRYFADMLTLLANVRIWLKEKAPVVFGSPRRIATFFIALLILLFCVFLGSSSFSLMNPSQEKGQIVYYPTGALEYIKRNYSSGNILTEFVWGEYLIWNLGPHMKVGLDGRYETVYQDHVANEYFDYLNGKINGFLDTYDHDLVLFRPDRPPVTSLRHRPDWNVVYEDTASVLFSKVRR
jgi:hypothetical protein